MTDTNYLYEYFLTHSPQTAEEPSAQTSEPDDNEEE